MQLSSIKHPTFWFRHTPSQYVYSKHIMSPYLRRLPSGSPSAKREKCALSTFLDFLGLRNIFHPNREIYSERVPNWHISLRDYPCWWGFVGISNLINASWLPVPLSAEPPIIYSALWVHGAHRIFNHFALEIGKGLISEFYKQKLDLVCFFS